MKGGDFVREIKILSDNKSEGPSAERRIRIFNKIRNPNIIDPDSPEANEQAAFKYMPRLADDDGDEGSRIPGKFRTWMKLMVFQYENLEKWSRGDFISDWNGDVRFDKFEEKSLEELSIDEQPVASDRAGLELSIGAPLYPGIKVTHNLYKKEFYNGKAFRINPNLKPGSITEQMAVPWQSDFYECKEVWWPTARPDDVIPENGQIGEEAPRIKWARDVNSTDIVEKWSKLGFVKPIEKDKVILFVEEERNL